MGHGLLGGARGVVASLVALAVALGGPEGRAGDGRQRDLYLASRDDIQKVLRRLDELPASRGGAFVGIIGGMAALNFIERLAPADILLVDLNPAQVAYGRCVVELVKLSASREAFASALFSRPFAADEAEFLSQPGDLALLRANTQRIRDAALRESCARDLALIAEAAYDPSKRALRVPRNTNGTFLQLRGPGQGMPTGFNFLYYDRGWLASDASYARTRATLLAARVRFLASDIGAVAVGDLRGEDVVFWGSNLSTWHREGQQAYERFVVRAHEALFARNEAIRFVFTSTYRRTATTQFRPFALLARGEHLDASFKVRRYAEGKRVLELIPGKARFGTELRAQEVLVQHASVPIDSGASHDVVVLHLLNNSGLRWWAEHRDREFAALYTQALTVAREVVLLEHDRTSGDFTDRQRGRMIGLGELLAPLFPLLARHRLALDLEHAVGESDNLRNMVLHVKRL